MAKKANEEHLGDLHGAVARVLTAQVTHEEEEVTYNSEGEEVPTGNKVFTATPATLAAAIKFLKDNAIVCDMEVNEDMNNLKEVLNNKQRHSRLTDANKAALKVVG